jgi:hypothetical protein
MTVIQDIADQTNLLALTRPSRPPGPARPGGIRRGADEDRKLAGKKPWGHQGGGRQQTSHPERGPGNVQGRSGTARPSRRHRLAGNPRGAAGDRGHRPIHRRPDQAYAAAPRNSPPHPRRSKPSTRSTQRPGHRPYHGGDRDNIPLLAAQANELREVIAISSGCRSGSSGGNETDLLKRASPSSFFSKGAGMTPPQGERIGSIVSIS